MRSPCLFVRTSRSSSHISDPLHLITCLLLLGLVTVLPRCAAAEEKVAIEQLPVAVRSGSAQFMGHYNPNQTLRLVFALKPPHMEEEEEFLRQLQDPDSQLFHRYLSEEEWNQRFAPSAEDEQAVVAWAQSQGFTITQRYDNRLLVDVEAPSAVIEKALDVTMNSYQIGVDAYFSNDRDPSLPTHLIGVVHSVMGLNNIQRVHSFSKLPATIRPPDYSPGPAYALGPHQERDGDPEKRHGAKEAEPNGTRQENSFGAYNQWFLYSSYAYDYTALNLVGACCNPTNHPNGAGPITSIAIAIWGDYWDPDLVDFVQNNPPIIPYNVQRHFVDGTPQCCYSETTLDVEWATAMSNSFDNADDTAKIHVYEAANDTTAVLLDVLNHILHDGDARVLSMSWGGAETYIFPAHDMDTYHAVFDQLLGQGWTLVAASGDGGATDDCANHLSVSYPASDPDVIAVGGTTLALNADGTYHMETGWAGSVYGCANNDGGSGGGCSTHFAAPSYQSSPACGAHSRSVPDIALNADWVNTPQQVVFVGQTVADGGTSIATPEIAGFFAQENAYLLYIQSMVGETCGGSLNAPCAPIGNANPYLYYEAYHPSFAPHYPFYDITYGCNGNDITQRYHLTPYCAAGGYDRVTGWGSANMMQLAWTLNDFIAGDSGDPVVSISGPPINHWYNSDQTVNWTVTDTSGNGHQPIGIAGSSQAWDADPGDSPSERTPGTGSSFYGPQFSGTTGSASGLSNLSQGCHTAFVRGWDNAGRSGVSSYGPLYFDNTPPTVAMSLSGNYLSQGHYTGPVLVTATATDIGSGVASTTYQVDSLPQQNYTAPFYVWEPGFHAVAVTSYDNAGNWGGNEAWFFVDSNTQYLVQIYRPGTGHGTVTSMDGIINCGTYCSHHYYDEQPVTLTATPDPGSAFSGWSGCDISFGYSCTFTMTADRRVYATFNVPVALQFIPLTPCRVADTRWPNGPFGGPAVQGGTSRDIAVPNSACNVPATAAAYSINVTVVPHGILGYLTAWPSGEDRPMISTMNSVDGRIKANAAIVPAGTNGAITIYPSSTTDAVLDIDGYFVPAPDPSALAFYALTPCRVADTRNPDGPLGGPSLAARHQRDLPVLSSSCGIPNTAQAYSMNFTAVPKNGTPLAVFNAWPAGQAQPATSVLNAPTGTVVANAAIVLAGTGGDIDVWASDNTDLVVDVDGYFAPAGQGGLSLYTNVPCRVLDTRNTSGAFNGPLMVNVVGANCGAPASAQAFVLNATVVPVGALGYLTLWPDGGNQPMVSTLNALDGIIASNLAIVPTTNGSLDAYASGLTNLVLDISSYFAP